MLLFLRLDATYQPKHPAAWERTGTNRLKAAKLSEPQSFIFQNVLAGTRVCQENFSRLTSRNLTGAQQKLSNDVISCLIWLFTHLRTTEIRNRLFAVLQVFAPENAVFHPFQAPKRRYSAVLFFVQAFLSLSVVRTTQPSPAETRKARPGTLPQSCSRS